MTAPDTIDVERHNDRLVVFVNGKHVATRDEKTNTVAWMVGISEADRRIIRTRVFDAVPPNFNRKERRGLKHRAKGRRG